MLVERVGVGDGFSVDGEEAVVGLEPRGFLRGRAVDESHFESGATGFGWGIFAEAHTDITVDEEGLVIAAVVHPVCDGFWRCFWSEDASRERLGTLDDEEEHEGDQHDPENDGDSVQQTADKVSEHTISALGG